MHIRLTKVPDDLHAWLKSQAAMSRVTIEEACIRVLENACDAGVDVRASTAGSGRGQVVLPRTLAGIGSLPATGGLPGSGTDDQVRSRAGTKACPSCGALNGMHQKGCKR